MSDRVFRVRGWSLEQFNSSKIDGLLDAEDVINDELLKIYDIVGLLVRVDDSVCFAAMEVNGFTRREGKKKVVSLSAKYSDLTSAASNYTVSGQIIKLIPSAKQNGYWEWAREYVDPSGNSKHRGKKQSLTTEVPSQLIHPLTVHMVSYPSSESRATELRWALSTEELQRQMALAWDALSPEFNNNILKFEAIPVVKNLEALPYRNESGAWFPCCLNQIFTNQDQSRSQKFRCEKYLLQLPR